MSRKYKFHNRSGLYFVSFATIHWIDVFTRAPYFEILVESLNYCRNNLGLEIYAWCIMTNHVHLIFRARNNNPGQLLGRLKEFTSKAIRKAIQDNPQESRREWILGMMQEAGQQNSSVSGCQLWQHHNQPIELWSEEVMLQKMTYTHNNPVTAGFVAAPEHWLYSSAIDYAGGDGLLKIDMLWE